MATKNENRIIVNLSPALAALVKLHAAAAYRSNSNFIKGLIREWAKTLPAAEGATAKGEAGGAVKPGAGRGGGRVDPGVEVLKREMKAEYVPIVAKIKGVGRPQAAHHDKKHPTTK